MGAINYDVFATFQKVAGIVALKPPEDTDLSLGIGDKENTSHVPLQIYAKAKMIKPVVSHNDPNLVDNYSVDTMERVYREQDYYSATPYYGEVIE